MPMPTPMPTPANPPADLNAWLRWVLDQREAEARLLCALAGVSGTYLRNLLAEVDAKRRILARHLGMLGLSRAGDWDGERESRWSLRGAGALVLTAIGFVCWAVL